MTAFACALCGAIAKDVGDGMQLLSLGAGACFPNDNQQCRCDLLVRDFYHHLFQRIEAEPTGAALLTGVPGIGKTWWIWYAVYVLLNRAPGGTAPAIVWQSFKRSANQCVLFKDGKAFVGHLDTFREELGKPSTWYFADGVLPNWVKARTVMVCSPKREVYKEWIKGRDIGLVMPVWTWPEVNKLWEQLYQSTLQLERVRRNYDLWYGGVPRHVLELPSTMPDELRDKIVAMDAIESTSIEQVRVAIAGQYDAGPEASHRIVHQNGDRTTFRDCGRQYATKHIGELFLEQAKIRGAGARLLQRLASSSNTQSSARGQFFETAAHDVVRSGGCFEYKFADVPCSIPATGKPGRVTKARSAALKAALDKATTEAAAAAGTTPGKELRLTVPELELKSFTAGKQKAIGDFINAAKLCASPCYLQPDNEGHPVIDACIYPDTLLNFKAAKGTTSVNEEVLEEHLQSLPDLQRYYLDYIVPADVYPTFKPAPLMRSHTRVARTYMRVVKVEAKLRPCVRVAVQLRMVQAVRGACFKALAM